MLLVSSGLSKDHTFLNLQITRSDIRPHIKWAVSLVIAFGHSDLPQVFSWICVGYITVLTSSPLRVIIGEIISLGYNLTYVPEAPISILPSMF